MTKKLSPLPASPRAVPAIHAAIRKAINSTISFFTTVSSSIFGFSSGIQDLQILIFFTRILPALFGRIFRSFTSQICCTRNYYMQSLCQCQTRKFEKSRKEAAEYCVKAGKAANREKEIMSFCKGKRETITPLNICNINAECILQERKQHEQPER